MVTLHQMAEASFGQAGASATSCVYLGAPACSDASSGATQQRTPCRECTWLAFICQVVNTRNGPVPLVTTCDTSSRVQQEASSTVVYENSAARRAGRVATNAVYNIAMLQGCPTRC